jgi:hypothetical protein
MRVHTPQGCVSALASLVGHEEKEVRIRALMGLGMLLPNKPANQLVVAGNSEAVMSIMVGYCLLVGCLMCWSV